MLGRYHVSAYTLNHEHKPLEDYRHDLPFVEGDTRTIQFEGEVTIKQIFQGPTNSGGWYDLEE